MEDAIRELLDRLDSLTSEELTDLRAKVVEAADNLDGEPDTVENVAALNELADAGDKVMAEAAARQEREAEQAEQAKAARERIKALRGEEEGEGDESADDDEAGDDPEDEPAAEGDGESEGAEEAAPAVTASGAVARMAARQDKPAPSPEQRPQDTGSRAVLTAAGNYGSLSNGDVITDREQLAEAMAMQLTRMNPKSKPNGGVVVASASVQYPPERRLGDDAYTNSRIMEQAVGLQAVLASGGICAPVNVDWTVETWATANRPLRDGLPAFEATRGGLRFVKPKDISALEGAVGLWSEATDAEPLASTKPVLAVSCGSVEEVLVGAVTTRIQFGNMFGRFAPEQVAMNTDLAMAYTARKAELNLLELIQVKCLKDVTAAKVLGATRDLVTVLHQATAAFRYQHRIDRDLMLTGIFPDYVKDLLKIDLARESAHQQGNDWNSLEISEEQVIALIKNAGINPIFVIDGLPEESGKYPLQGFATQSGTGAINTFPEKLVWNLFPEGSIQFLDGGRLDLGVVRDSTLDATNDYETFSETFEGIADRGFENSAIQYVTTLCGDGASAATSTAAESHCA